MLTPISQLQVLVEYCKPHLEQSDTIPRALATSDTHLPSYQHTSSTALFPTILSPSRLRGSSASRLLFLTTPTANKFSPEHLTHRLVLPRTAPLGRCGAGMGERYTQRRTHCTKMRRDAPSRSPTPSVPRTRHSRELGSYGRERTRERSHCSTRIELLVLSIPRAYTRSCACARRYHDVVMRLEE